MPGLSISLLTRLLSRLASPCLRQWQETLGAEVSSVDHAVQGRCASVPTNIPPAPGKSSIPPISIAVISFPLTTASSLQELAERLEIKLHQERYLAFVEFKLPERNIELPAYLLTAPLRFIASSPAKLLKKEGGLEGLLYRERQHVSVLRRQTLLGGTFSCILVRSLHQAEC